MAIRDIFENLGDLTLLADILKHVSSSDDPLVLVSAADTLLYHIDAFIIIGASVDIHKSLLEAYSHVNKADPAVMVLISSLLEVAIKLPNEGLTAALLRRDLCRFDRRSAMVVSSPVSDHPTEIFDPACEGFPNALNQCLNSGCGMDDASISRVFDRLTEKLQNSREIDATSQETSRRLSLLRTFNPKHFDGLMVKWITSVLKCPSRPCLLTFLPSLVGVGCVTLHAFFTFVGGFLKSEVHRDAIPDVPELRFQMVALLCVGTYSDLNVNDIVSSTDCPSWGYNFDWQYRCCTVTK